MLTDGVDEDLKRIIHEFQEDMYKVIKMEIMPEHVHLLIDCNPYKSIRVRLISSNISSIKVHCNLKKLYPVKLAKNMPCLWTRSAFISSVDTVSMEATQEYIQDQKKHSRKEK